MTEALLTFGLVVGLVAAVTAYVLIGLAVRIRKLERREQDSSSWQQAPDDDEDD